MASADEVSAAPPAVPADLAREPVCYLETTGRVSGRPHEIEIWFVAEGSTIYMLSGGGYGADWVKNLQTTPRVRVRIGDRTFAGSARVLAGESDELHARQLVAAKYYGWREGALPNDWAREALPVAIRLDGRP